ncbi:MAG: hypothetical protein ABI778_07425, partial [Ignavibacteriota bacterium]
RLYFYGSQQGKTVQVLLEGATGSASEQMVKPEGYSENYVRVNIADLSMPPDAELIRVRLGEPDGEAVRSELLEVITRREELSLLPILQ